MLTQIGSTLDISKGRFLKNKMEGKMEEYKLSLIFLICNLIIIIFLSSFIVM